MRERHAEHEREQDERGGAGVVGGEERGNVEHHGNEFCARVKPVHNGIAGEVLAERNVLQHAPASFLASSAAASACGV